LLEVEAFTNFGKKFA